MEKKALWGTTLPGTMADDRGDQEAGSAEAALSKKEAKRPVVRVGRETKGRRGKGVTVVYDLKLPEPELQKLATLLKSKCGTGGTIKDGCIEIQGEQRDRVASELASLGYQAKKSGG